MTDNGSKPDPFPCSTFEEAAPFLRRPFTPENLKWKLQSTLSNKRGLCVPYVDSRLIVERLNLILPSWSEETRPFGDRIDAGLMVCTLTIPTNDGMKQISDVGEGSGPQKVKAAWSDSLKRCAVRLGIGAHLYSIPTQILASTENGAKKEDKPTLRRAKNKKGDEQLWITPACEDYLANAYRKWLDEHGTKEFGPALGHGDTAGSVGALLEGGAAADEPQQDDLELAAKRAEAEDLYKSLAAKQRPNLPPGRFDAKLRGSESAEQLDKLLEEVRELAAA